MIERLRPMLAESISPNENLSKYEGTHVAQRKHDGTRVIVIKRGKRVQMMTRSWKNDLTSRFPEIAERLSHLAVDDCVLDCELIFFNPSTMEEVYRSALITEETKSEFGVRLMVFDVLEWDLRDLRDEPYQYRMSFLPHAEVRHSILRVMSYNSGFRELYQTVVSNGGEGIMLKRLLSPYRHDGVNGNRSKDWLKVKIVDTADCVVMGLQTGKGKTASTFGALIVGQYEGGAVLREVARVSGMTDLERLHLLNQINELPRSYHITEGRDVQCAVAPSMVVEVAFMERTDAGRLRHPRFVCVRADKSPEGCVYEP
jgi:ATP-dependent DNA ligase